MAVKVRGKNDLTNGVVQTKKVSLKDIADAAGVSTALVSFVLNGKGKEYRVGEKTAIHILEIAAKMNYKPNQVAKSLRSGKTNTIGVVLSDISNPFFSQIARHIEDHAEKSGYTVLFASSDEDAEKMARIITSLLNRGVDGLIVVPCENSEKHIAQLADNNTPLVLLDRYFPGLNVSYVALNSFQATYDATIHLLEAGYESPGMVAYDIELSHMRERIRGYKKAMADHGLKDAINVGYINQGAPRRSADKLVPKMVASGTDALIFGTNMISLSCIYAVRNASIEVPRQLGLIGFDGSDTFEFFYTPLTYIKQPVETLVQKAVSILIDSITNGKFIQSVLIDGELIKRESTKR